MWTGWKREFRQHNSKRTKKPTVWTIEVNGNRVTTTHGQLGGKMQTTSYVGRVKNRGKSNEISAEEDALAEARRDVRKKWDFEGFDEYVNGENIDKRNIDISIPHLLTNLPGSFCLYKPQNNLLRDKQCAKLLKKAREGKAWFTIKRDGMAMWIVKDHYGNIRIYSRRNRPWNDKEGPRENPDGTLDYTAVIEWTVRFDYLVKAVEKTSLPNNSMLAGELIWVDSSGVENFDQVSTFLKAKTEKAKQEMQRLGRPVYYIWDVPFYEGQDLVSTKPMRDRFPIIFQLGTEGSPYLIPLQKMDASKEGGDAVEAASDYAKSMNYEGWVVIDPDGVYGDRAWNLKGKPERPAKFCAKLKPVFEDDFIAFWDPDNGVGTWGSGKHEKDKLVTLPNKKKVRHGGVGSVGLFQYNKAGELIYICDCSSGFDYETQALLTPDSFPLVLQVEYRGRNYISNGDKTNALRFPTVVRVRDDKSPEECVNEAL